MTLSRKAINALVASGWSVSASGVWTAEGTASLIRRGDTEIPVLIVDDPEPAPQPAAPVMIRLLHARRQYARVVRRISPRGDLAAEQPLALGRAQ